MEAQETADIWRRKKELTFESLQRVYFFPVQIAAY